MNGLSMFSGGGIAETYFQKAGIYIKVANEVISERAAFYSLNHPDTIMVSGDITDQNVFNDVIRLSKENKVDFILATPPCQGFSSLGFKKYEEDQRNFLIYKVIDAINELSPQYVMIENVPKFSEFLYPFNGRRLTILEILAALYSDTYQIDSKVLDACDYGVPQHRPRFIIKLYKKGLTWPWPLPQKRITLREAIADLPSIEAGESSDINRHCAPAINNDYVIEALRHTPTGKSALQNPVYYPKKKDGTRIKGFHNTYKRMSWDEPCPARTVNNQLVSGHNNVHPGRLLSDGTYSDARALSFLELLIVSSLPKDWKTGTFKESLVRVIIGEAVPPMLAFNIVKTIGH